MFFFTLDQIADPMPSLKSDKDAADARRRSSSQLHENPAMENDEKRSTDSSVKVRIVEGNHDDEQLSTAEEEKQFEEEIEDIDAVEQIQTDMVVPPGAAEMTQATSGSRRNLRFLSKLP